MHRPNKPFILGKCQCGYCDEDIPIRGTGKTLQKFKYNHHLNGVNHHMYKGEYLNTQKYVEVYQPNHKFCGAKKLVKKHRLVYEQYYKCCLLPWAVIHHLDRNKQNNNINNLMAFPSHSKHVSYELKKDMSNRYCLLCLSKTTVLDKKKNPKWYKYKNGFICDTCYQRFKRKSNNLKIDAGD